jgi:hypothetical protein
VLSRKHRCHDLAHTLYAEQATRIPEKRFRAALALLEVGEVGKRRWYQADDRGKLVENHPRAVQSAESLELYIQRPTKRFTTHSHFLSSISIF